MPSEPPEHSFEQSQHQQILILVSVSERAKGHLVSGEQLKKKSCTCGARQPPTMAAPCRSCHSVTPEGHSGSKHSDSVRIPARAVTGKEGEMTVPTCTCRKAFRRFRELPMDVAPTMSWWDGVAPCSPRPPHPLHATPSTFSSAHPCLPPKEHRVAGEVLQDRRLMPGPSWAPEMVGSSVT